MAAPAPRHQKQAASTASAARRGRHGQNEPAAHVSATARTGTATDLNSPAAVAARRFGTACHRRRRRRHRPDRVTGGGGATVHCRRRPRPRRCARTGERACSQRRRLQRRPSGDASLPPRRLRSGTATAAATAAVISVAATEWHCRQVATVCEACEGMRVGGAHRESFSIRRQRGAREHADTMTRPARRSQRGGGRPRQGSDYLPLRHLLTPAQKPSPSRQGRRVRPPQRRHTTAAQAAAAPAAGCAPARATGALPLNVTSADGGGQP